MTHHSTLSADTEKIRLANSYNQKLNAAEVPTQEEESAWEYCKGMAVVTTLLSAHDAWRTYAGKLRQALEFYKRLDAFRKKHPGPSHAERALAIPTPDQEAK